MEHWLTQAAPQDAYCPVCLNLMTMRAIEYPCGHHTCLVCANRLDYKCAQRCKMESGKSAHLAYAMEHLISQLPARCIIPECKHRDEVRMIAHVLDHVIHAHPTYAGCIGCGGIKGNCKCGFTTLCATPAKCKMVTKPGVFSRKCNVCIREYIGPFVVLDVEAKVEIKAREAEVKRPSLGELNAELNALLETWAPVYQNIALKQIVCASTWKTDTMHICIGKNVVECALCGQLCCEKPCMCKCGISSSTVVGATRYSVYWQRIIANWPRTCLQCDRKDIPASAYAAHMKTACARRPVDCTTCSMKQTVGTMHLHVCPYRQVPCTYCRQAVPAALLDGHIKHNCRKSRLPLDKPVVVRTRGDLMQLMAKLSM